MIRPQVIGGCGDDFDVIPAHFLFHNPFDDCREGSNAVVFVARVKDLSCDSFDRFAQHLQVEFRHVLHVKVRPQLGPAEDGDFSVVERMIRQNVDGQIQSLSRRIAA